MAGKVDLVLEGGGVKGIGLVGALAVLFERGFEPENVAGSSAGAIAAALVAAGYSPEELRAVLSELDFTSFEDPTWEDRIPLAGKPLSVLLEKGIYRGERFLDWITGLLAAKGVHRFADLIAPDYADDPRYRYRLRVIASDITGHRLLRLPQDAADAFGIDPDELSVAEAVRMSMSIPIFFEPWRLRSRKEGPERGREFLIVDGGLLSNFPVWIFDSDGEPPWPTFGLMLVEPDPKAQLGERLEPRADPEVDIVSYARDLLDTMLEARDRMYLSDDTFVRTIGIPTLGVRTTDFGLPRQKIDALYESGRSAAEEFLDRWSFDRYKARFRATTPPGRRQVLADASAGP